MKVCTKCCTEKPLTDFRLRSNRPGPRSRCRQCEAEDSRSYRAENPEKRAATRRRYSEANREKEKEYTRTWRLANPERVREYNAQYRVENRDFVLALMRRWQINNPERVRANSERRRARKAGVECEPIDRDYIYGRDGGRCHICGKAVARSDMQLDHLIPIAHGGPHVETNLRVAHPTCNFRMGAARLPAQLLLV